jgi:hypothetical protein
MNFVNTIKALWSERKNNKLSTPKTQQPQVRFGPFEAMILASFIFTVHFQKDRVIEHDLCFQNGAADRHGESALTQK